jgi:hypothetical protein
MGHCGQYPLLIHRELPYRAVRTPGKRYRQSRFHQCFIRAAIRDRLLDRNPSPLERIRLARDTTLHNSGFCPWLYVIVMGLTLSSSRASNPRSAVTGLAPSTTVIPSGRAMIVSVVPRVPGSIGLPRNRTKPIKASEPGSKKPRVMESRVNSSNVARPGTVSKKLDPTGMTAAYVRLQEPPTERRLWHDG